MLQFGWIVFIVEHIIVAMPSTVKDDELLAALRVTGCHQSGSRIAIYNIRIRASSP